MASFAFSIFFICLCSIGAVAKRLWGLTDQSEPPPHRRTVVWPIGGCYPPRCFPFLLGCPSPGYYSRLVSFFAAPGAACLSPVRQLSSAASCPSFPQQRPTKPLVVSRIRHPLFVKRTDLYHPLVSNQLHLSYQLYLLSRSEFHPER